MVARNFFSLGLGLAFAGFLAGCSTSVPLPHWPTHPVQQVPPASTGAGEQQDSERQTDAEVTSAPVQSTSVEPLPYSGAVAEHFPDPEQRYELRGMTGQSLERFLGEQVGATDAVSVAVWQEGSSRGGEPIYALLAAALPDLDLQAIDASRRPTVMLVAGQGGGAGSDAASTEALLTVVHELGTGGLLQPLLSKMQLLIVPRLSPDGVDVTQDHLKLSTPEARSLARLIARYRPSVMVEVGEFAAFDPAKFDLSAVRLNDLGVQYALTPNADEFIVKAGREWFYEPMRRRALDAGLSVDWLSSAEDGALTMQAAWPTTLTGTAALRNSIGLGIYSRGSDLGTAHLQRRIHSLTQALESVLQSVATHSGDLPKIQDFARRDVAAKACQGQMLVAAREKDEQRQMSFIDLESAQIQSHTLPWRSALEMAEAQRSNRPCGYWISPEATPLAAQLDQLGIEVQRVADLTPVLVESYSPNLEDPSKPPQVQRLLQDASPGSYYVSMAQPLANLAASVIEPASRFSAYRQGGLGRLEEIARVVEAPQFVFFEE